MQNLVHKSRQVCGIPVCLSHFIIQDNGYDPQIDLLNRHVIATKPTISQDGIA